ncbi:hypothetical protein MMC34_001668 [Xylographa carneopallida]|nr:hypothetical protein [Xylographa carneopallida]
MASHPETTIPPAHLPFSTSPTLHLTHPTPAEKEATWRLNGAAWRGRLSLEAYLRREHHLAAQPLTQNGGITYWILVDSTEPTPSPDPNGKPAIQFTQCPLVATPPTNPSSVFTAPPTRTMLASCETLRKRALIAHRASAPAVTDITAHGIGSVFCAPALRKRGYAGRMMTELNRMLTTHQQADGQASLFNVLYSDIGKQFYARRGWHARESRHVALPAVVGAEENGMGARPLYANDLGALCEADEKLLMRRMGRWGAGGVDTRVAFVPDEETMAWHHAREEFATREVLGRWPDVKGAMVEGREGRVWAIWTRTFGAEEEGNVLHVLRMVVEGDEEDEEQEGTWRVEAAAEVLRAAQREAGRWAMKTVEVWNPEGVVVEAARRILGEVEVVEREEESITSLMWYGEGEVEWVGNEKYGWC